MKKIFAILLVSVILMMSLSPACYARNWIISPEATVITTPSASVITSTPSGSVTRSPATSDTSPRSPDTSAQGTNLTPVIMAAFLLAAGAIFVFAAKKKVKN